MNTYIVAFVSFDDNNLFQKEINAGSPEDAVKIFLNGELWDTDFLEGLSVREMQTALFDTDSLISVYTL